jgi:hypothetical protein
VRPAQAPLSAHTRQPRAAEPSSPFAPHGAVDLAALPSLGEDEELADAGGTFEPHMLLLEE